MSKALSSNNYIVYATDSMDRACEIVQENHIDIALINFKLDDGHIGTELLRKKNECEMNFPLILITQYRDDSKVKLLREYKLFDDILFKPVPIQELLDCVRKHIGVEQYQYQFMN